MNTDNLRVKWIEVEASVWEAQQAELKALREENRKQALEIEHLDGCVTSWKKTAERLESQLAELHQGGEAVATVFDCVTIEKIGGFKWGQGSFSCDQEIPAGTKLFTRPQPAIPPGYVVVQVEPDKAALIGEFSFPIEHVCDQCPVEGDCGVCDGSGLHLEQKVVPWTTIKEIIAAHIASAPAIQPAIPPGHAVVKRADLEHAHQQAALAEQLIVNYAAAGLTMYGYLDDSCSAAGIAAKRIEDMLAAAPSVPVAEKDDDRFFPVEVEVWQGDEMVASASGIRDDAMREAYHYAAQYEQDGPVRLFELIRKPLAAPADSQEG